MSYSSIYLGENCKSVTTSPEFEAYSRVEIKKGENDSIAYSAGSTSGRTLTVVCPYATQGMANSILSQVNGYKYTPYESTGAYIDPSAEIGDGITVNGLYSGIFSQDITFSRSMTSTIKAPSDEELTSEYGYIDENGKFATYASLANGTATVDGSCVPDDTLSGSSVISNSLNGSKVSNTSLSEGKTTFTSTLNQVGTNASNIATNAQGIAGLQSEFSVIKNGNFGQISTSRIVLGNYSLYVTSAGDCRGTYIG